MTARLECDTTTTTTTMPLPADVCGRPCSGEGAEPKATDALYVLRGALGLVACEPCVCDVDSSGTTNTTDALRVLRRAIDSRVELDCEACTEPFAPHCG